MYTFNNIFFSINDKLFRWIFNIFWVRYPDKSTYELYQPYPWSLLNFLDRRTYLFHQGGSMLTKSYPFSKSVCRIFWISIFKNLHFAGIIWRAPLNSCITWFDELFPPLKQFVYEHSTDCHLSRNFFSPSFVCSPAILSLDAISLRSWHSLMNFDVLALIRSIYWKEIRNW